MILRSVLIRTHAQGWKDVTDHGGSKMRSGGRRLPGATACPGPSGAHGGRELRMQQVIEVKAREKCGKPKGSEAELRQRHEQMKNERKKN